MMRLLFAALALALAACSPASTGAAQSAQNAAAVHPVSGLEVIPLTVIRGDKRLTFKVEVAKSPIEQGKGLMFRTALAPDEGMLFPMKPPRLASFYMRNTVIPLDLIFVGPDGRILNIAANAIPYDESQLRSAGPVKAVLELNGGRSAALGIVPGDRVEW
jgi:uncharacterized membrane protein (UPF0127 family)